MPPRTSSRPIRNARPISAARPPQEAIDAARVRQSQVQAAHERLSSTQASDGSLDRNPIAQILANQDEILQRLGAIESMSSRTKQRLDSFFAEDGSPGEETEDGEDDETPAQGEPASAPEDPPAAS
jgi:hypothetical protein